MKISFKKLPFDQKKYSWTIGRKGYKDFEAKTIDFLDLLENFPEMGAVEVAEK